MSESVQRPKPHQLMEEKSMSSWRETFQTGLGDRPVFPVLPTALAKAPLSKAFLGVSSGSSHSHRVPGSGGAPRSQSLRSHLELIKSGLGWDEMRRERKSREAPCFPPALVIAIISPRWPCPASFLLPSPCCSQLPPVHPDPPAGAIPSTPNSSCLQPSPSQLPPLTWAKERPRQAAKASQRSAPPRRVVLD